MLSEGIDFKFDILPFSDENLEEALSNEFCSLTEVAGFERTQYILRYLRHEDINIKTIIVEKDYTDGDYLDDYISFYGNCFQNYQRRCKRLHFFSLELTRSDFIDIVVGGASAELVNSFKTTYKGFIVARPLPKAIIGRSVLATYSSDGGRRHYPCIKTCNANLFGIDLMVKSLEYQEQDTVLAACATVALWCCFHKTSEMFHTPIWSPATITRTANEVLRVSRPIPSHGLVVNQIHNAIIRNGLVAEIFKPKEPLIQEQFIPLIYGYLRAGLPVIFSIFIEGQGLHAITLTGYSLRKNPSLPKFDAENDFIPFLASTIDKFYAHDDQIGPFSRIWAKIKDDKLVFDGSWMNEDGTYSIITPDILIVPIYHKIRVTFVDVQKWLSYINWILFSSYTFPDDKILAWDLYLTTINELKREIISSSQEPEDKSIILFAQHPRFIWRAILYSADEKVLELFADATDIPRAFPFYHILVYKKDLFETIKEFINDPDEQDLLIDSLPLALVNFLKKKL